MGWNEDLCIAGEAQVGAVSGGPRGAQGRRAGARCPSHDHPVRSQPVPVRAPLGCALVGHHTIEFRTYIRLACRIESAAVRWKGSSLSGSIGLPSLYLQVAASRLGTAKRLLDGNGASHEDYLDLPLDRIRAILLSPPNRSSEFEQHPGIRGQAGAKRRRGSTFRGPKPDPRTAGTLLVKRTTPCSLTRHEPPIDALRRRSQSRRGEQMDGARLRPRRSRFLPCLRVGLRCGQLGHVAGLTQLPDCPASLEKGRHRTNPMTSRSPSPGREPRRSPRAEVVR